MARGLAAVAAALLAVIAASGPAHAFKWHSCPAPPLPVYPSTLGAVDAPFVHPGHPLRILLNASQVAASGGFGVDPDSNEVAITFASLFGDPVALPVRRAAGLSNSVLPIEFPDAESELGRVLAGPVGIRVTRGGRLIALIDPVDLVGLPPASDVTALVLGEAPDQEVPAALGADGDLWVPVQFQGDPVSMPMCPGNFIHPLPIQIAAASADGVATGVANPLAQIRGVSGYLGDIVIAGTDFYGMLVPQRINLVHVAGSLGVSICRLNDAVDLVLRVQGVTAWARSPVSPMRAAVAGSAPLVLNLQASSLVPGVGAQGGVLTDSLGASCDPQAAQAENAGARR